jgi:plastocyanin
MEETLFYVFGAALVLSALVLSALGLRSQGFPASRVVFAGLVAYFVVLVGATSTFAVLNAREEQRVRDAEHAEEAAEAAAHGGEQTTSPATTTTTGTEPEKPASGGEQTVKVSSPASGDLVFEPSELTAKAGTVTISYDNPSPVPHSVAIEEGAETLAESETVTEATTSATADLEPGGFVFYCTVPGHREAGMEGTLTVR